MCGITYLDTTMFCLCLSCLTHESITQVFFHQSNIIMYKWYLKVTLSLICVVTNQIYITLKPCDIFLNICSKSLFTLKSCTKHSNSFSCHGDKF